VAKWVNDDDLKLKALTKWSKKGIVFNDEIDKITSRQETGGAEVSRHGVQRDLLPWWGTPSYQVRDDQDRITSLLSAAALPSSKPSDLIPELPGRFPIRGSLKPSWRI